MLDLLTASTDAREATATPDEVALLRGMVEIESHSGSEQPLAEYLCAEMQRRGLHARIDGVGNAIGDSRASNEGGDCADGSPTVLLLGHMDTAPGHVAVRQEGHTLYGRGAVDAKGPLAAFICAASRLQAISGPRIVVVGAVEEESASSCGARHLAAVTRPDYCVIGEPSHWDRVTLGYKGRLLVDYAIRQGAAHTAAATPTAAQRAVEFWTNVQALARSYGGTREFERLTPTLRRIHGESDGVMDVARMEISLRLPPACDSRELRARIRALAGEAELRFAGDEHAYRAPKNTALVRAFLASIRSHGGTPAFTYKTGTSDMNIVAPVWDCPILAYGPGDSALDHTPDEHLDLREYGRAIAILARAIHTLAA